MSLEEMWNKLVELEIATEQELILVTAINGYNEDALLSVLYARTALNSFDQLDEEY